MEIPYNGEPFQGINYFLFSRHHYHIEREIEAKGDKYNDSIWSDPIYVFDPNTNESKWASADRNAPIPLTVEYFHFLFYLTNYTIKTRDDQLENMPQGWDVHGSFDGTRWELLHSISNSSDLTKLGAYKTYECLNSGSYRFFRFNMTEMNSGTNGVTNYHFHINKIEFFGTVTPFSNPFIKPSCTHSTFSHIYYSIIIFSLS